ncbi:hypothetical protein KSS87_023715 [Heliosperma pusillum]|nr:hypothetical protein KSS87_023715 [Heliosperma pusillum]KAH9610503.1 hypothetical protein KSS87_023715 [Heliosperma pusillum]KAH9610505.1 hypothetical protein KSS87_023715 [Heliosperma pusillum]
MSTKNKKGPLNKDELSHLDVHCQRLEDMICSAYSGGYSLFTIEISNLVYSYESPIKLIIMFADIREIFRYEWLNISILQLWGSFLYEYGTQCGVTKELVGFLCPDRLCTYMHSSVEMERYLTAALKKQQDKRYVIGAFYESSHWMLVVFYLRDNIAYIFDSDQATKKKWEIKSCLSLAWKRYSFRAGTRNMSKKKTSFK